MIRWLAVALVAAACDGGPIPAAERGRELFSDPGFSDSQFNSFSCATCHGLGESADEAPRIGGSLAGSAARPRWWGGYAPTLLDAVNECAVFFMRATPLGPSDERGRALYELLVSVSPATPQPARALTVVENITTVPRGDPARGRAVYDRVCRVCHGDPHTGRDRLSRLVSIIPETSNVFAQDNHFDPALVAIEKVRHGKFFGVGGDMPFFSREALSDADLGALLAYLGL